MLITAVNRLRFSNIKNINLIKPSIQFALDVFSFNLVADTRYSVYLASQNISRKGSKD